MENFVFCTVEEMPSFRIDVGKGIWNLVFKENLRSFYKVVFVQALGYC